MNRPIVSLDLETTGFLPSENNIIEIGAIRIEDGKVVDELSQLVNPAEPIPPIVTSITSITDDMVADAPSLEEISDRIRAFVKDAIIVGHNITFDIDFLAASDLIDVDVDRLDTWRISELVYPNAPSNSLEVLSSLIGVTHESAHRALDDAKAAYTLFERMQDRLAVLPKKDVIAAARVLQSTNTVLSDYLTFCASLRPDNSVVAHWSDLVPIPERDDHVDADLVGQAVMAFTSGGHFVTESLHGTLLDLDLQAALEQSDIASCVFARPPSALSFVSELEGCDDVMVFDEPYAYVSWDRLSALVDQGIESPDQARLCALVSIWRSSLSDDRMGLLGLRVGPHADSSVISLRASDDVYQALGQHAAAARMCIIPHGSVISPSMRSLLTDAHVVIESAMSLERAVEMRARYVLNEPLLHAAAERLASEGYVSEQLPESLTILFGLTGMAVREWRDWHDVAGVASFSSSQLAETSLFWRVELVARSILDRLVRITSETLPDQARRDYMMLRSCVEWLCLPPPSGVAQWWFATEHGPPVLHRQPALVRSLLVSQWDLAASVHAVDDTAFTSLPPMATEPLASRIGLQKIHTLQSKDLPIHPTVLFPIDMPAPGEPDVVRRMNTYIERAVRDLGGSIVVVATSQTMVRDIYHSLIESDVAADISVYAHQVTGGMGKSLSKYIVNADKSLLILGSKAWGHRALHALSGSVDTLILPKVPFTPLGDPLYQVKQEAFPGFESFSRLQLPDMIRSVRSVVRRIQPRQILIGDVRIHSKSYGRQLMKAIGTTDPRTVSLSTDDVYNV